jgi:hypothetical protein
MDPKRSAKAPPTPRTAKRKLSMITSAIELKTARVENAKKVLEDATHTTEVLPKKIEKLEDDIKKFAKEQDKLIDILVQSGEVKEEDLKCFD